MAMQRHVATSVSLPPMMLQDLREEAKRRDMSISQLIREYVRGNRIQGQLDLMREEAAHDNSH